MNSRLRFFPKVDPNFRTKIQVSLKWFESHLLSLKRNLEKLICEDEKAHFEFNRAVVNISKQIEEILFGLNTQDKPWIIDRLKNLYANFCRLKDAVTLHLGSFYRKGCWMLLTNVSMKLKIVHKILDYLHIHTYKISESEHTDMSKWICQMVSNIRKLKFREQTENIGEQIKAKILTLDTTADKILGVFNNLLEGEFHCLNDNEIELLCRFDSLKSDKTDKVYQRNREYQERSSPSSSSSVGSVPDVDIKDEMGLKELRKKSKLFLRKCDTFCKNLQKFASKLNHSKLADDERYTRLVELFEQIQHRIFRLEEKMESEIEDWIMDQIKILRTEMTEAKSELRNLIDK